MSINHDDPKLTAYALGELPQEEAAEVERLVEKDPALQAEVESIRQVAEKLKATLAAEPLPGGESKPGNEPVQPVKTENKRRGRRWILAGGSVVAVGLVFVVFVLPAMQSAREAAREADYGPINACQSGAAVSDGACAEPAEPAVTETLGWNDGRYEGAPRDRAGQTLPSPHYFTDDIEYSAKAGEKPSSVVILSDGVDRQSEDFDGPLPPVGALSVSTYDEAKKDRAERQEEVTRAVTGVDASAFQPGAEPSLPDPEAWERLTKHQAEKKQALDPSIRRADGRFNTETYDKIVENEFKRVSEHPLSTFSIDVDTAAYSRIRGMLTTEGRMPPPGVVRLEELINYFDYAYAPPTDEKPFATHVDAAKCPWNDKHSLVRIGLKGKVIEKEERDPANLVFLLDVSGSMGEPNKLPLVKESMKKLVANLNEKDRVAIAVYAGAAGLVLPSTPCNDRNRIFEAIARLEAGGSTNGGQGIELAYATAAANFIEGGVNRVILCTDGDFNIGVTNQSELISLIEKKAKEGVFLTVLGFGMGNYKDSTLEKLADKGNGNYGYIDTDGEADKMLVEGLSGTLVTIAKDVKIQVEFNPHHVKAYRLLGYENRMLKKEDFNDDTKDAGEIGAGHTVTALYELIPADSEEEVAAPKVDDLKYQKETEKTDAARSDELLTVKLRYKEPDGDKSKLLTFPVKNEVVEFDAANVDLKFASSVAAFGMLLRDSQYKGTADYDTVLRWAKSSLGEDKFNYREEFLKLIRAAKSLENR